MMTDEQRAVVNAVLYMVQFARELGAAEVERVSNSLLNRLYGDLSPEREYQALVDIVACEGPIDTVVSHGHSAGEVRMFLGALVARLDENRPWSH